MDAPPLLDLWSRSEWRANARAAAGADGYRMVGSNRKSDGVVFALYVIRVLVHWVMQL